MGHEDQGHSQAPTQNICSVGPDDTRSPANVVDLDGIEVHAPGSMLGRYVIRKVLGAGGMGVVYEAYDPQLTRKVAIKVLRTTLDGNTSPDAAASATQPGHSRVEDNHRRLMREAKALAKLSHDNVVSVFDVGVIKGAPFFATEFVEARTLSQWWHESPRSWRETVDIMLRAGAGLSAAHESGLVHRDFKPDNVLIGHDGRVLVIDFGLVLGGAEREKAATLDGDGPDFADGNIATHGDGLTHTGAVMGTPSYMSPEQRAGYGVDAASDQLAFCVTLYEGLFGEKPGGGRAEWLAVSETAPQPASGTPAPPAWLWAVIRRGLQKDPNDRFISMASLLQELARRSRRRDRQRRLALVASLCLSSLVALPQLLSADTNELCRSGANQLHAAWDDDVRIRAQRAFGASDSSFAGDSWTRIDSTLQGYRRAWLDSYSDSCEATHVDQRQSMALLDLRMACLQDRSTALRAMSSELATADAELIERSIAAVLELPPIADCNDLERLKSRQPLPDNPSLRDAVRALQHELAQLEVAFAAGRLEHALTRGRALALEAAALGYEPLLAKIHAVLGQAHFDERAKVEHLERALSHARAAGDPEQAATVANALFFARGYLGNDHAEAENLMRQAMALVEAAGRRPEQLAELYFNQGVLSSLQGDHASSLKSINKAARLTLQIHGEDSLAYAKIVGNIADAQWFNRNYEAALAARLRSRTILMNLYGAEHPQMLAADMRLATAHADLGRAEDARRIGRETLARCQRVLGQMHVRCGVHYATVADLESAAGHIARSGELLVAATEIQERLRHRLDAPAPWLETLRSGHARLSGQWLQAAQLARSGLDKTLADVSAFPDLRALAARELAEVQVLLGDPEAAHAHARRALEYLQTPSLNADIERPQAEITLGIVESALGDHEAAIARLQRALELSVDFWGGQSDHPNIARVHLALGRAHLAAGQLERARRDLERALRVLRRPEGTDKPILFETLVALAQYHVQTQSPARVLELDADARRIFAKGERRDHMHAELHFATAQAHRQLGAHRSAQRRGRMALAAFRARPGQHAAAIARVSGWLAQSS